MIAPRQWLSIGCIGGCLGGLAVMISPREAVADGPPASSALPVPFDAAGGLAVDGAAMQVAASVAARLELELRGRPLRQFGPWARGPIREELVARVGLHVGILLWLQAGLSMPVSWTNYALETTAKPQVAAGDLRLYLKAGIVRGPRVGLAVLVGVVAPTGNVAAFRSDGGWSAEPRLALDVAAWRIRFSLVAGARLRATIAATGTAPQHWCIGPELTWGGAVRMHLHDRVSLVIEAAGSEALFYPFAHDSSRSFALLGSIWIHPSPSWTVFAGGGKSLDIAGIAVRTDDYRVITGITWRPMAGEGAAAQRGPTR